MPTIKVKFVLLDDGEYLYDESTCKLYTCQAPHKFVRIHRTVKKK